MKKRMLAALLAALCLLLAGCGSAPAADPTAAPVAAPAATAAAASEATLPPLSDLPSPGALAGGALPVQNDLTQMSSTMVYGYVFSMLSEPENYIGQSFRLRGAYNRIDDETTGETYHFVVIADALACCAQGMEFRLPGDNPAYPAQDAEVEIVGVYASYEEDGLEYVRIEAISLAEV